MAYKGVLVSLNPRKTPCMAKERRTAGAPRALNVKYLLAGVSIEEPYQTKNKNKNGAAVIHLSLCDNEIMTCIYVMIETNIDLRSRLLRHIHRLYEANVHKKMMRNRCIEAQSIDQTDQSI